MKKILHLSLLLSLAGTSTGPILAQEADEVTTLAVLDFDYGDRRFPTLGSEFADLLNVEMSLSDDLILVERAYLEAVLSEQEMSLSGMVDANTAAQVGKLIGADVLVSGRIIDSGSKRIAVARMTGVDNGRVFAEKVVFEQRADLVGPTEELGEKVASTVSEKRTDLVPPPPDPEALIKELSAVVGDRELPVVSVRIPEIHIGRAVPDPAVETEIVSVLQQLGFQIVEPGNGEAIRISGEAFSELALRKGNLVSCRGRAEVKAVNEGGDVVFVDRETSTVLGLGEFIAGKDALEQSARQILRRLVPALVAAN